MCWPEPGRPIDTSRSLFLCVLLWLFVLFNNIIIWQPVLESCFFFIINYNLKVANSSEANRRTFKQSQSMMASSFNMGELLRNTTQLLAGNCDGLNDQNATIDLSINETNMSHESVDTESRCSSLKVDEFVDSDEEDIAELDKILLKLMSIGVEIKSVVNNQAKLMNTVKKN